jgi:hypothetical protein
MATKINVGWHRANKMPKNPTPQQRLDWHVRHAKACACRPLSAVMLASLQRAARSKAN